MKQRTALYPGTFDPLTNGHLDIIQRAMKLCDKLVIGVALSRAKGPLFSIDERVQMVRDAVAQMDSDCEVEVVSFEGLLIKFVDVVGASMVVRGLRAVSDFEYEFQMACMNDRLNPNVETVFLMADPEHQAIASRLVKEICRLGGDISSFVPSKIKTRLKEKYA